MTVRTTWARLDSLLDAALSRPRRERRAFLDEACGGDAALRARVEELLQIAEAEDPDLQPGAGLQGILAREVLDDLAGEGAEVPLPVGTRLGRFEVTDFLGAGSVGRVYRARDPTLGREVAIKALAEAFRSDPGALRRFEQEARVLATLNHPNIASIYGLETIDGAPYLVLELIEGDTLEERLRRGPLPLADAVDLARQMAEALEEAHRQGVVHRDLKPSNVKLTGPGRVKVLDFGLARATASASGSLPPYAVTATVPGVLKGTAPYMSPEQARGLPVDARSDIWAFGCVLYEMLAGRRVFAGRNVADVLAAVTRDEVDWTALPAGLPPALRLMLERCLRRDVHLRLQDIGDARLELSELDARAGTAPPSAAPGRGRWARAAPWLLAAACLAGLLLALRPWGPALTPGRTMRSTIQTPPGYELAADNHAPFAFSPDGSTLAFRASRGMEAPLFVRSLDQLEARPVAGTVLPGHPFFSPDGQWLAFLEDKKLKKVALAGGTPITLAVVGAHPAGASWGEDGSIVLSPSMGSGLSRVNAEGGRLEPLTRPDASRSERSHRWPQVLPGGQAALFTVHYWGSDDEEPDIEAVVLRTGRRQPLLKGAYPRFLPPRHLVFVRSGRLFAVGFDPVRLALEGTPQPVLEGVRSDTGGGGGAHVAIARDGTLVYVAGLPELRERSLAWMDLDGLRTRLPGARRRMFEPRLDPAGERAVIRVGVREEADIWIQHLRSGTLSQLTFGLGPRHPIWTRDGKHVTVSAESGGRWRLLSVPVDGGDPRVLHEAASRLEPNDWSPDGRFLAFQVLDPERGWDLKVLELGADGGVLGAPRPLAATGAHETSARFSADGRWLAYQSDEGEDVALYVAPFGRPGVPVNAAARGRWPVWGEPGELFYWVGSPSRMFRIGWREAGDDLYVRSHDQIWPFPSSDGLRLPMPIFDFHRPTRRFLHFEQLAPPSPAAPYQMTLVTGWGDEVRRRLAAADP